MNLAKTLTSQGRRGGLPLVFIAAVLLPWAAYMAATASWDLFHQGWPISLTMALGSFIAGSTPQGGAAVAFPVFTKMLHIPADQARTFGLMIQSVGMSMATITILARRLPILPRVIAWSTAGGVLGQILGNSYLILPDPYPRVFFTFGATVFGAALAFSRWGMAWRPEPGLPRWSRRYRLFFLVVGIFGGLAAAHTGSGADMLVFIVLTLIFSVDVKISTPTSVVLMALNSLVGFFIHGAILQDIGPMWDAWLVAVPIVAIGAPLGALAIYRIGQDALILIVLGLIAVEFVSTLLLIPFNDTMILATGALTALCAVCFGGMLFYRQRRAARSHG